MDSVPAKSTTVEEDAEAVLRKYLGITKKVNHKALLDALEKKINEIKSTNPKKALELQAASAAVAGCMRSEAFRGSLPRLIDLLNLLKEREIHEECPNLCIKFQDLAWDDYYKGGNIKYPDVRALEANCCPQKDPLIQKMQLFFLLQNERRLRSRFNPWPRNVVTDNNDKLKQCPAILIPSGGKDGAWLGKALKDPENFWWVRCKEFAKIVFLISAVEVDAYKPFADKGIDVVSYEGFGMGCGRAAGILVAMQLQRLCIMTDDRTKGLCLSEKEATREMMLEIQTRSGEFPFITGVQPKGELNILTLINPKSTSPERVCFSPFFIASKEDKALHLYCEILEWYLAAKGIGGPECITRTAYDLRVRFDSANPTYENNAVVYKGEKGNVLSALTDSHQYRAPDATTILNWTHLMANRKFLNLWDAIKMQDSAMFLLLQEIHQELKRLGNGAPPKYWNAFDAYIRQWFSL